MKIFKINRNLEVVCQSESTRYGFRHLASLIDNGRETVTAKCCYYNRTWERFEFESVLENLLAKAEYLSASQRRAFKKMLSRAAGEPDPFLKTISMVAKMGEVLTTTQKEANDWKIRMLKAGLENRGLDMPEDWQSLTEDEKERRLNGVVAELSK